MLKKIHLDRTHVYEIAIATNYIAKMLDAFIEGRSHAESLGCEQGDIGKWDDLILEIESGVFEHIQVKRQLTNFLPNADVKKGVKLSGKNKGTPYKLSPLDESLKSLADWSIGQARVKLSSRYFVIEVPDYTVEIKKGYTARNFYDLCQVMTNTVTVAAINSLALKNSNVQSGYIWLTTWCGFQSWEHIIDAFRQLCVRCSGLELDVNGQTESLLARHFIDPFKTRKIINSYIDDNSSYTEVIKPRRLLFELEPELIKERETWSQYNQVGTNWGISGTTNLKDSNIEDPKGVARKFWKNNAKRSLRLMTHQQSQSKLCNLTSSLIRFSLHFEGNSSAIFNELGVWEMQAKQLVGGTLGVSENDFQGLNWSESNLGPIKSENRSLMLSSDRDVEAQKLSDEMYTVCWEKVCSLLECNISVLKNIPLRDAIEVRWLSWKALFNLNIDKRNLLLKNMLSPKCEGDSVLAELRVGPKTANLLADGIKFLLIVSTALYDKSDSWNTINDGRVINTLALNYWSGALGQINNSREITDEDGIGQLLGTELNSILIMSQVGHSPSEVLNESLAFDLSEKYNLATSKTPDLLITNSLKFKRLVNKGSLQEIRDFFEINLKSRELIKEESIQGVISA
jgi:hypothetical protein